MPRGSHRVKNLEGLIDLALLVLLLDLVPHHAQELYEVQSTRPILVSPRHEILVIK